MPLPTPDTIVAIATPPGRGGIGVVRLSGPRSIEIVLPLLRPRPPFTPNRAHVTRLIDRLSGEPLDEVVVTAFAAPHSYTGENVVEISGHGAPVLLAHLVAECLAGGARLAEPGEFTQCAFLSGRLDLTAAEAVHDLVASTTLHQARVAAAQLGGALSRSIAPAKQQLIHLIATLEAGIDFAEDDLELIADDSILAAIESIAVTLTPLERSFRFGRLLRSGFSLALVGRPNAGKSSLFNALLGRNRAIVTGTPGTTRDLVSERLALEGLPVELIDTAGLRETTEEIEAMGIAKSREAMAEADLMLLVVDSASGLQEEDLDLLEAQVGRKTVVALNKSDLVPAAASQAMLSAIERATRTSPTGVRDDLKAVSVSAVTGHGLDALRHVILDLLRGPSALEESAVITNLRQHTAVSGALAHLETAGLALRNHIPHEMLLLDLHEALRALDALTGETTTDDILHLIFSTFCIGK